VAGADTAGKWHEGGKCMAWSLPKNIKKTNTDVISAAEHLKWWTMPDKFDFSLGS
jgi:hypothetical protein